MRLITPNKKPKFDQPSIFLAGPSPRADTPDLVGRTNWRYGAVMALNDMEFTGTVFSPEMLSIKSGSPFDYESQVEWEYQCLENCTIIAFWVPRVMPAFPGLTTNVEFGRYVHQQRTLYGRPDASDSNRYLDWLYDKVQDRDPHNDLGELMEAAASLAELRWGEVKRLASKKERSKEFWAGFSERTIADRYGVKESPPRGQPVVIEEGTSKTRGINKGSPTTQKPDITPKGQGGKCKACGGTKWIESRNGPPCPCSHCGTRTCPDCYGTGEEDVHGGSTRDCRRCRGTGKITGRA
jgi:hypothetical protein